jgi:hypothetical protein
MVAQVMATGLSLLVNVLVEVGGHHPYSPEQSGYGGWCWAARAVKFLVTVFDLFFVPKWVALRLHLHYGFTINFARASYWSKRL